MVKWNKKVSATPIKHPIITPIALSIAIFQKFGPGSCLVMIRIATVVARVADCRLKNSQQTIPTVIPPQIIAMLIGEK